MLWSCVAPDTVTVEPNCAAPPTDTAACKCVAPTIVVVPLTYRLPPTVALLTDILPAIVAVTPVMLEPSP